MTPKTEFKTVYKILGSMLDRNGEDYYIKKEDLESLAKNNLPEYNLLYFLRKSKCNILDDYPCMGAFERRLHSSVVEGPFEFPPDIGEQSAYSESDSEVIKLFVQKSLTPLDFENVSLMEYGTQIDPGSLDYLRRVAAKRINPEQMMESGKEVLDNLNKKYKLQQVSKSSYKTSTDDFLLEFFLEQAHIFPFDPFYPLIKITVFGRGEIPQNILQESGIYKLREQFSWWDKDVGIKDLRREGLAYNLDFNNNRDKDISEIIRSENILL